MELLKKCTICPRSCKVNREADEVGYCNAGKDIKVARAALHFWEEPCISGTMGSGTVFFSHCNLKCVFCQNYKISHEGYGKTITIEELSKIFLNLQAMGAHNINLVTPTHFVPQIIESIKMSKENGLRLPILYNSSGYEKVETIKMLEGFIDVYLPDLKYFDDKYAKIYSNAPEYFQYASESINEMVRQTGEITFDKNGLIKKGVIIRHLMLPGLLFDSKKIIDYVYNLYRDNIYISIMNQYTPMNNMDDYPEINKLLNPKSYDALIEYALSIGVKNAYIQEDGTCSKDFIPSFDLSGI